MRSLNSEAGHFCLKVWGRRAAHPWKAHATKISPSGIIPLRAQACRVTRGSVVKCVADIIANALVKVGLEKRRMEVGPRLVARK